MDKRERSIVSYKDFSKGLDFYDPIDQELYILTLHKDFQKAAKDFIDKHGVQRPSYNPPKHRSWYVMMLPKLVKYSRTKDKKLVYEDFMAIVKRTNFGSSRYYPNLVNGLAFYLLFGLHRQLRRPSGKTESYQPMVKMRKHSKLGVREAIRITMDLFIDSTEDEARTALHQHWPEVETLQRKLVNKQTKQPAQKSAIVRDSYLLHLSRLGLKPKDIVNQLSYHGGHEISPNDISKRIIEMETRVKKAFTP